MMAVELYRYYYAKYLGRDINLSIYLYLFISEPYLAQVHNNDLIYQEFRSQKQNLTESEFERMDSLQRLAAL